ncbi:uncharacterized protein MONOS_9081 [Monocercomonoides exilis]|uniref:uncharacterized protein n=1 Tax=Monocercomonoides exilis TaxID=2049356 RepID=UPI00355A9899|nr:hypothetical protein MONOS_9081 [Monocercomonoides exilis]|eukprot:MONOS_9081.1-p1 / transcript=MONOS_9081.1 / gene=MONOS_9081 / organism=Monocercomonoides_exilis_PA203 / gene_product=unspecified product / transcript_product=unspecified product / location=Mono_scaffold00363:38084-38410(-) / protein_length=109 / sequence_SO=supercontig / SO=protein_coding / is_pseudo=false
MEEDLRKEKEEEEKRRMRQQREEDEAKLLAESRNKKEDEILVNNDIVEEFRDELVQEDAYVDISKLLNEISKGDADGHMLSTNWEDALSSDKSEAEELLRQLKIPDNY